VGGASVGGRGRGCNALLRARGVMGPVAGVHRHILCRRGRAAGNLARLSLLGRNLFHRGVVIGGPGGGVLRLELEELLVRRLCQLHEGRPPRRALRPRVSFPAR
jgi:hypothetical protein